MSAAPLNDPPPEDAPKSTSDSGAERADWLVGPDEGLAAELERSQSKEGQLPRPTLLRPDLSTLRPEPPEPIPFQRPAPPARPQPGAVTPDVDSGEGFERGPVSMKWEPGARSVPALDRARPARSAPEPTHDFPMDDAEERARTSFAPPEYGPPAHEVIAPEAFDVSAAPVPWWIQVLHTLRTDRRIQLLVAGVLVVLATVAMWPRGERPMSVSSLRRHAGGMDGVPVMVAGTVGQVFPVGGGYAFYLHDGRDTLVVFTRVRHPEPRQHVTVRGTMSTGFLDGQPTFALFESNQPR
jgi:hypothetical protein